MARRKTASRAERAAQPPFEIGGSRVLAGTTQLIELPVARLPAGNWMSLEIAVVHGAQPGRRLWLSAAIHGDEIGGAEIIHRVLEGLDARALAGTVVAVPVVNVFGFAMQTRTLPDRRDLNRSFPGSQRGSLAARMAHLFMNEIVARTEIGIDLHTGPQGRTNLPQLRGDMDDAPTARLARAFGAPVMIHSRTRDGSLREAATRRGKTVLLYEGGEALRFDARSTRIGVEGVLGVMRELDMLPRAAPPEATPHSPVASPPGGPPTPLVARETRWLRARRSGIVDLECTLGELVRAGQRLAIVRDTLGRERSPLVAPHDGLVISLVTNPLVNQGDALIHLTVGDVA